MGLSSDPAEAIVGSWAPGFLVPGSWLGLSGHVRRIWRTDFDAIFFTDYCYGLVVHAIV